MGVTEPGTTWLQEMQGHLLRDSSHPVYLFSGTSWWAILGPVAFPPLEVGWVTVLHQRGLSCPFSRKPSWIEMRAVTSLGWSSPFFQAWRRFSCGPAGTSSRGRGSGQENVGVMKK